MMYGYGTGGWWMMLMPLLWIAFIAVLVWAAVRFIQPGSGGRAGARETPLEILDRRYAQGEIDDSAYTTARARLTGREPSTS
ncbi:SHOCT domain-containing protein [Micromonospora sp. SL4-19]|uniref:SHOCT domain-containing protein n=1 Tax=Micromonospora sp. SL4-19 TaxID=3399129 RepID=UPI003A4D85AC